MKDIKKERQQTITIIVIVALLFLSMFNKYDSNHFILLITGFAIVHHTAALIISYVRIPSRELLINKNSVVWLIDAKDIHTFDVISHFEVEENRIILVGKEQGMEYHGLRLSAIQQQEITEALQAFKTFQN